MYLLPGEIIQIQIEPFKYCFLHVYINFLFRSSFRDVLRAVEEAEQPAETIKFGKETLRIESWFVKIQYDWFCKVCKL